MKTSCTEVQLKVDDGYIGYFDKYISNAKT